MAIPDGLFRLSWSGFYEDRIGHPGEHLWEWALVWHVLQDPLLGTDDDYEGIHLAFVQWARNSAVPAIAGFMSQWTVIETAQVDHLADGMGWVESPVADGEIGENLRAPVSPQSAILVIGQTQKLGRQTRKWLPCIDSSQLGERVGLPNAPGPPIWTRPELLDWAARSLSPRLNPLTLADITPVVYDPVGEVAEPITRIRVQRWPRTIRRRTNDASPLWYDP